MVPVLAWPTPLELNPFGRLGAFNHRPYQAIAHWFDFHRKHIAHWNWNFQLKKLPWSYYNKASLTFFLFFFVSQHFYSFFPGKVYGEIDKSYLNPHHLRNWGPCHINLYLPKYYHLSILSTLASYWSSCLHFSKVFNLTSWFRECDSGRDN